MMDNFQPMDDRLLVRRLEKKPSLLILTDEDINQLAVVLAIGPGKRGKTGLRKPLIVRVGDIVLIPGVANTFPDFEEGEKLLITEGDIGGVLEGGESAN